MEKFLDERTLLISGKTIYTHRSSVKAHLKWLYMYKEYLELRYLIRQISWKDLTHNLKSTA